MRAHRIVMGVVMAAAAGVAPGAASAAETHTFEGTCGIVGVATLDHPVTVLPSPNHVVFRGDGSCSGTLDGAALPAGGAPVRVLSSGSKLTGCTNTVVPRLDVAITFYPERKERAPVLQGTARVTFTGPQLAALFQGATDGTGAATGTVQGGKELLDRCLAGRLSVIGLSQDLRTFGPVTG